MAWDSRAAQEPGPEGETRAEVKSMLINAPIECHVYRDPCNRSWKGTEEFAPTAAGCVRRSQIHA